MKLNRVVDAEESVDCDSWAAAFWRREMCSITPPWRARTPTVICWGVTASRVIVSAYGLGVTRSDVLSWDNGGPSNVVGYQMRSDRNEIWWLEDDCKTVIGVWLRQVNECPCRERAISEFLVSDKGFQQAGMGLPYRSLRSHVDFDDDSFVDRLL